MVRETGKDGVQSRLIKRLKVEFPGILILKNDANYLPGIPDLTVLYRDFWAFIEVKATAKSPYRPNQEYYLQLAQSMGSGSFTAHNENLEDVINGLQQTFQLGWRSRLPQR